MKNELSAKNLFNGIYQIFISVEGMTPSMAAVSSFEFVKGLIVPFIEMSQGDQKTYWKSQLTEAKAIYKDISEGFGQ